MSHLVCIEIEVKDLDSLAAACTECGLELARDQKHYRWFGRLMGDSPLPEGMTAKDAGKCDHAIRVPGNDRAYEIGVRRQANGTFKLAYDFWQGGYGLEKLAGEKCGKLVQSYAAAVAVKQVRKQGFAVQRRVLADGRVQLVCSKG